MIEFDDFFPSVCVAQFFSGNVGEGVACLNRVFGRLGLRGRWLRRCRRCHRRCRMNDGRRVRKLNALAGGLVALPFVLLFALAAQSGYDQHGHYHQRCHPHTTFHCQPSQKKDPAKENELCNRQHHVSTRPGGLQTFIRGKSYSMSQAIFGASSKRGTRNCSPFCMSFTVASPAAISSGPKITTAGMSRWLAYLSCFPSFASSR